MSEGMTLEQFRAAKQSGEDLYAEPQQQGEVDAAPIEQEIEQIGEPVDDSQDEPQDDAQDTNEPQDEADPIPQEQQSAWKKRAERERRKGAEETEARLKAEYETQINPYKKFFDQLGIDPDTALQAMEQNKIKQEAETLAYQNGWDETQTQWYVKQQQQDKEMRDLRVSVQINDLADRSDYPGIKQMKTQIAEFVTRNPNMSVQEAYWAVGGQPLAQQLRREAEQREIAKRQQTKRTVVSDAPAQMTGPAPLPPEAVAFMRQNRMSEAQVRELMRDDYPKDLESYRKMNKGRK
jgi:hypothetical protein